MDSLAYSVGTLKNSPVTWEPNSCPNPHLCISGATGTGKTYMIREIVESFGRQGVSFTIIDKHGDIDTLPLVTEYRPGYSAGIGINPLSINSSPNYGGPMAAAQAFLSLLKELSGTHKLGPVQENMLFHSILELYRANKIIQEDPASWLKQQYPDLKDLERFLNHKYKKLLLGGPNGSSDREMDHLNRLYREKKKLERLERGGSDVNEEKISETIARMTEMYEAYLRKGIINDSDFMTYSDPKGLVGLKNRLQQLNNVGVFIKNEFPLKNTRVNMKFLEDEQKKIITFYILKRLIEAFQRAGYRKKVAHYVIIDESSFFLDIPKIEQLIVKISQECRKFGLGIILSTQNPLRFCEDILLNTATKIVFMVEPILYKGVSRAYGIEENWLKSIEPRHSCMFSTRNIAKGTFYIVRRNTAS